MPARAVTGRCRSVKISPPAAELRYARPDPASHPADAPDPKEPAHGRRPRVDDHHALGPDKLFFAELTGTDEISQPFAFQLTMASEDVDIRVEDLLGKPITVKVGRGAGVRFISGLVDEARFGEIRERYVRYHATLRPALWVPVEEHRQPHLPEHERGRDHRGRAGRLPRRGVREAAGRQLSAARLLRAVRRDRPRLRPAPDGTRRHLVFPRIRRRQPYTDPDRRAGQAEPVPGFEEVAYRHDPKAAMRTGKYLTRWHRLASVRPATHTHTDYDFEKPAADLMAKSESPLGHPQDSGEQYHYPGNFTELSRGDDLAALRRQEHQSPWQRIEAQGTAQGLSTGCTFKLTEFPRAAENDEYAVLSMAFELWDSKYTGTTGRDGPNYAVRLVLTPKSVDYRPHRRTPKPVMKGPQTAVVVGPGGDEIYTDEYARVKVQFHWDRQGSKDENSSCWVRVSAAWAGAGWGFIQIPRIGQEVIVDFLEGDPDQPIITGRVYNAAQMPPYDLPANKTQSGWKSNSSLGGGGWNELRFEDKKGSEEVYFQAEKDHVELVKNDETRTIGHDWVEDVGNDATQTIGNDRTETVKNNKFTTVEQNRTVNIGVNDTEDVGANRSLTVGGNETRHVVGTAKEDIDINNFVTIGLAQKLLVKGGRQKQIGLAEISAIGGMQGVTVGLKRDIKVGSTQSHYVQSNDTYTVNGNQTVNVNKNQEVKVKGDQSFWIDGDGTYMITGPAFWNSEKDGTFKAAKNVLIEAGDAIVIKTGKASISMKKDGTINIEGKDITINGSGKINVKASGETTIKGSKINQN
jgi:type VI secretion system secreted protein VgrG